MKTHSTKIKSKAKTSAKDLVKFDLDIANPATLTKAQKAELAAIASQSDASINHADIPPLADAFWQTALRNPFYKPTKQSTTVRVDSDVLHWLKSDGKGYQTRINTILRNAMVRELA